MARQPGKPPQDRPTVDLKSAAEVYLVKHALDRLRRRYLKAAEEIERRGAPSLAWMMRNKLERIQAVWAVVPEEGDVAHLANKEQVDWASRACEGLITELRLGQFKEWDPDVAAMISILAPLLDRIQIGWKRPAPIPEEVLAQIKAREDGRFYNKNVGDWLEVDESRVDELDVYSWRSPEFDLVEDFEWIGLRA